MPDIHTAMNIEDALQDDTVPGLTKTMIECALSGQALELTPYQTTRPGNYLYVKQ